MKSDYNAHFCQNIYSNDFTLSYGDIENNFFQDIIPIIYQYFNFTKDKNNFSLVSKKWTIISDYKTKIISIYRKYYTSEGLFAISQRFKFVEKFQISSLEECDNFNFLVMGNQKEIKSVDEGIKYFNNLTYLDLSYNLTITDDCIKKFTNLKILNLEGNDNISDVAIQNFTNLTDLDLSYNLRITDDCIKNFTNLKILNLEGNDNISDVAIQNFTNLTDLDCGNNITNDILTENLTNLTKLDIANSLITGGDPRIGNLTKLKILTSSYYFEDSDFVNLTNLRELNCFYSEWVTSSGISHLTNLISLKINPYQGNFDDLILNGFTKLTSLNGYATDDILIHLPNLQTLVIYNTAEVSAYGIKSLVKLTDLTIHDEGYEIFDDDWIPHLTNLTSLKFKDTPPAHTTIFNIKQTLTNLKNFNINWRR